MLLPVTLYDSPTPTVNPQEYRFEDVVLNNKKLLTVIDAGTPDEPFIETERVIGLFVEFVYVVPDTSVFDFEV